MKKLVYSLMAVLAWATLPLCAQEGNILSHFSLSAGIGTTGVTADVGTMVTDYVGLRGGIDFMPKFKYSTHLTLTQVNYTQEVDVSGIPVTDRQVEVKGTLHNTTGHALVDIYPLVNRGFHVTVGAYVAGNDKIVDVINEESELLKKVAELNARRGPYADVPLSYGQVAAKMGDYNIMPDDEGNASAYIKVRKVRPYLGVGFGRAVPTASRLSLTFDMGVQFSGTPHVYNGVNGQELTAEGARGEDGGYLKTISRIHFYPVVSLRLSGLLF